MVNYEKSVIYKLCCNDLNITEIYIGSTTNFLRRKQAHRDNCNNDNSKEYNKKVYKLARETGGFDNWSMIQIEQYNAKDKRDLEQRERYYIEQLKATLNCYIPGRTQKEHYIDNKEIIKEQKKKYYIDNKEKIKKYYNNNKEKLQAKIQCECGCIVNKSSLTRHKKSIKHIAYLNTL